MKRFFILTIILHFFLVNAFAEEVYLVEEINAFGGETLIVIFDEDVQRLHNYSHVYEYYDSDHNIVQLLIFPTDAYSEDTGLLMQAQFYRNDVLLAYEKVFNDEFLQRHDYNRLVEHVNQLGQITSRSYYHNDYLLTTPDDQYEHFEFFSLSYIENAFFEGRESNDTGSEFSISMRYVSIRSLIDFDTELYPMEASDYQNIRFLESVFGFQSAEHLYDNKVRVFANNASYWFYVQRSLEPVISGQRAVIRYYPIGRNGELFLVGVGFVD